MGLGWSRYLYKWHVSLMQRYELHNLKHKMAVWSRQGDDNPFDSGLGVDFDQL